MWALLLVGGIFVAVTIGVWVWYFADKRRIENDDRPRPTFFSDRAPD